MTLVHRLKSILSWIVRRSRAEARLDEEMETFLDMSAAEKIREGVPPAQARRLARLELGGAEQVPETDNTRMVAVGPQFFEASPRCAGRSDPDSGNDFRGRLVRVRTGQDAIDASVQGF